MKILFWRHQPATHDEALESAKRAREQLEAVEKNRPRVREDSTWAKRTRELDPLTALFIANLGGKP